MTQTLNPLQLLQKIDNPILRWIIAKTSQMDVIEGWYQDWLDMDDADHGNADAFITYTLGRLNVDADVIDEARLNDIPKEGACVIVGNHPLGGIEGMMLTQILMRVRPDLKVLTNELLSAIPEFSDVFIGVDVFNEGRAQYNAKAMRSIASHLSKGGALLVFPAGTVSTLKLSSMRVSDAPWTTMIARLAKKYNAPVMPIYVGTQNPLWFYVSGLIHPRLRTLLLPRAMVSLSGQSIKLQYGSLIPDHDLKRLTDDAIATHYMRLCCKVMAGDNGHNHKGVIQAPAKALNSIKGDVPSDIIKDHMTKLSEHKLYSHHNFEIYCAPYNALGPVMEQLSIVREHTFRKVDEGTGHELDSDQFDPHYMHLILWDKEKSCIAGGYRLGKVDEIVAQKGLKGLYSHSLFDYDKQFLKNMGRTIEVGRSFITSEYQRNPMALDMLWKGIGYYVAQNPEYHTLFGCVSISKQYSKLASAMLTETFLSHYGVDEAVSKKVKARVPMKKTKAPWTKSQLAAVSEIPIINKLVGRIDAGKSIPVLIRHYLALNGQFISFTVNNGFNDSLDGLIMVDLRTTSLKYLKRYMGTEGAQAFLSRHITKDTAT